MRARRVHTKCQKHQICTRSSTIQKFPLILVVHPVPVLGQKGYRGQKEHDGGPPVKWTGVFALLIDSIPCRYLSGMVNYLGLLLSRHCTAYCKHPHTAEWYVYDPRVRPVDQRHTNSSEA